MQFIVRVLPGFIVETVALSLVIYKGTFVVLWKFPVNFIACGVVGVGVLAGLLVEIELEEVVAVAGGVVAAGLLVFVAGGVEGFFVIDSGVVVALELDTGAVRLVAVLLAGFFLDLFFI